MFVFAALAVILLMTFALRICVVSGPSMNNTLQNGERLIVSDLFYTPKEGDVIVFHQTSEISDTFNEPIVKRIIATGGKHVRIDYDQKLVYVSEDESFTEDEIIDESSYAYFTNEKWTLRGASDFHVPEGHLFVMGDNRNNSADSRDALLVGFVDERRVLGKVLLRIMPLNAFGKVE
jgi:signal peptidase I